MHETFILIGLTILCVLAICADLATAHGSFLVNGWRVWNNATIFPKSKIETTVATVQVSLGSQQTLWIGSASRVQIDKHTIFVEKGCAQLDAEGVYSLDGKSKAGLSAGSDAAEMARASQILLKYRSEIELRPTSQRP